MLLGETVNVALGAIRSNKLRSFLTMLGIIIGIAAVITMVSLGAGAQRSVQAQLQSLGSNVLTVNPGRQFFGGVDRGRTRLEPEDADALVNASPNFRAVSPEMTRQQQVAYTQANATIEIVGGWPSYFPIQNSAAAYGRLFNNSEERGRRRLAVLGASVGPLLGVDSTRMLLGQTISIRSIPFEVIGVLAPKGEQGWRNPDENIYIPFSTARYRVIGSNRINNIYVQATSAGAMNDATADIDRLLRRAHRIRPGDPSDFSIRNQTSLLNTFAETTQTFTFLLAGIAFISLVVGGIGIMNIMLVSVTERTREIGIRKALGARRRDIMFQFLIEALVLCLAGGLFGIGLGIGGAIALQKLASWNTAVAPSAIGLAFLFSAGIGLFFGIWPARRAARLDPIVSLRYE